MKYLLPIILLISGCKGCIEEAPTPRGQHSTISKDCIFTNPTHYKIKVVKITVTGSKTKNSVAAHYQFQIRTHSFLPTLAPQFRGIAAGADIVTSSFGDHTGRLWPTNPNDEGSIDLDSDEEIVPELYEGIWPEGLKLKECVFEWSEK